MYYRIKSWFIFHQCCFAINKKSHDLINQQLIYHQWWFLCIPVVVSGVRILVQFIWQHPTFVPISAYLLISQSLTDSDSHKSDQTEIWTLGTFFSSSRVNAEKLRCFLPAAEKNYQSLIWRMHRRRWDITKRISRCISIESLWMQNSF